MASQKIVIASANPGKLAEFEPMLSPRGLKARSQTEFGIQAAAETGATFVENSLIKARAAAQQSGLPALADDSGLVVRALDGRPGIHSARYAGVHGDDQANIEKLLQELEGLPTERRGAFFYCCLVLLKHPEDPAPLISTGCWHGYILDTPRGTGGFGYDPVFYDPELGATAAQLPSSEKNRVSHRGKALAALLRQLDREGI